MCPKVSVAAGSQSHSEVRVMQPTVGDHCHRVWWQLQKTFDKTCDPVNAHVRNHKYSMGVALKYK